ncbi:hypothetical protein DFH07DRAFT_700326, partial [Mycena maculata]
GDKSKFSSSTDLVYGQDTVMDTYLTNPMSTLLGSDLAGRKLVRVDFTKSQLEIGGFKAHDYTGDGSFYLLDVPGVCLTLVSPTHHLYNLTVHTINPAIFVLLGADTCHHAGVLRPTEHLHKGFPCPGDLLAATRRSISATHFPPPDPAGEFDLAARISPLLDVAETAYFADPPTARVSVRKLARFDADVDVFVVLAHDESIVPVAGPFPTLLNECQWRAKGAR